MRPRIIMTKEAVMLREKLGSEKCFKTAWGKLITEEEGYTQINRQIAAFCADPQNGIFGDVAAMAREILDS